MIFNEDEIKDLMDEFIKNDLRKNVKSELEFDYKRAALIDFYSSKINPIIIDRCKW